MPENASPPSIAVTAAATILFLVSAAMTLAPAWFLVETFNTRPMFFHNESTSVALIDFGAAFQVLFCLVGIITSVGLFRLDEYARQSALFLSTVPNALLLLAAFYLITDANKHRSGAVSVDVGLLGFLFCAAELLVLLPLSIWWLILFTRKTTRSQFR